MDPAPDPAIFVIDLQDANRKLIFLLCTSTYIFVFPLFAIKKEKIRITEQVSDPYK